MKKLLGTIVYIFFSILSFAQFEKLDANNIEAGFHSDGLLFSAESQQDAGFNYNPDNIDNSPATIFAANLWTAGRTAGNDIYSSRQFYYGLNSIEEYQAGPSNVNDLNVDFNKVWKVNGVDLRQFREDWLDGVLDQSIPLSILDWPAKANENIQGFPDQDLAPFFDATGDGIYNPSTGDFPIIGDDLVDVIPDQMVYSVFNDSPNSFDRCGIEYHTIAYAFECNTPEVYNNTVFTRHIIKNQMHDFEEFLVGFWKDPDLGCYTDDFVGCSVAQNCIYTYNEDPTDGEVGNDCQFGIVSFEGNPPVQATKYLNHSMSNFIAYFSNQVDGPPAMHSPATTAEVFNNLTGSWRDGTPMTYGQHGYNPASTDIVDHLYPDLPTEASGWSMFAEDLPTLDMRLLSSSSHGVVNVGDEIILDLAHFVSSQQGFSHIQNATKALEDAGTLGELYLNNFEIGCDFFFSSTSELEETSLSIWPNPAANYLNIETAHKFERYQIFDSTGKLVRQGQFSDEIRLGNLEKGVFTIRLLSKNKVAKSSILIN